MFPVYCLSTVVLGAGVCCLLLVGCCSLLFCMLLVGLSPSGLVRPFFAMHFAAPLRGKKKLGRRGGIQKTTKIQIRASGHSKRGP